MKSRWPAGLIVCALALLAARQADAMAKSLDDCPILKALASSTGGRSRALPAPASPLTRVGRGVRSMLLAPLELPVTMGRTALNRNVLAGMTTGALNGTVNTLSRFAAGALDVVTAPIPGGTLPPYVRPLGRTAGQYGLPVAYSRR